MAQIIQQGSTPTHTFATPYKKAEAVNAIITYWQNGRAVCEKRDFYITINDFYISTKLTQKETLSFDEDGDVKIQIKVKLADGKVVVSNDMYARVKDALNKEEI